MDERRGTGRTTKMLVDALGNRSSAGGSPILIYGANMAHADSLRDLFARIAMDSGAAVVVDRRRGLVVVDGCELFEFRSYHEEDSPLGKNYSYIYRDHYALEVLR